MQLAMPWSFCPHCGAAISHQIHKQAPPAPAEHTSAPGGFGGLLFGVLLAPVLIIVGVLISLTGLGAILGIPMIIAGVVAPLAGPLLGLNAHQGKCPGCGTAVSTMAGADSYDCPTCNRKFAVLHKEAVNDV
jgi:DNA-directed RNA polymerase subunit RPC12/RpoP